MAPAQPAEPKYHLSGREKLKQAHGPSAGAVRRGTKAISRKRRCGHSALAWQMSWQLATENEPSAAELSLDFDAGELDESFFDEFEAAPVLKHGNSNPTAAAAAAADGTNKAHAEGRRAAHREWARMQAINDGDRREQDLVRSERSTISLCYVAADAYSVWVN